MGFHSTMNGELPKNSKPAVFKVMRVQFIIYCTILSTGKFDTRGRPIPGLAKLPQDKHTSSKQSVTSSYNMEPQDAYKCTSTPMGLRSYCSDMKSESNGKIYVGGMPPSLSEAHLHVYFSQFGTVVNVTLIRDRETGEILIPDKN